MAASKRATLEPAILHDWGPFALPSLESVRREFRTAAAVARGNREAPQVRNTFPREASFLYSAFFSVIMACYFRGPKGPAL